ncbi:MAG: hypothetical protein U0271_44315 [Polyangiaceae bacterium]
MSANAAENVFRRIYDSSWHHPGVAFAGVFAFVLALARTQRFVVALSVIFAFEAAADALVTGGFSPTRGTSIHNALGIAFVILGDLRYFAFATHASRAANRLERRGLGDLSSWGLACALAMIVPVASTAPQLIAPKFFTDETRIYLLYEVMFVVLALLVRALFLPRRLAVASTDIRVWIYRLTMFEIAQYGLWILSDVLILSGVEFARVLRLVPNALYYAGFLPLAFFAAPARLRDAP